MQHRIVTRVSWSLSGALFAAALLFGVGTSAPVTGSRPATAAPTSDTVAAAAPALFEERCSQCHKLAEAAAAVAEAQRDPAARARWLAFLRGHHAGADRDASAEAVLELLLREPPTPH